eukprot:TRINITY_DN1142_c0_g1_i2.p2 TRINITY_DN1142_c0_g1~~TRINITY_DN1142_c0_g1_i2.p2  ORF type:complete len:106 (-),score=27.48 TRINITY_DN1142_c0_g1_i2:296-613(-)
MFDAAAGDVMVYYKADNCYLILRRAAGLFHAQLLQAAATKAGENVEHVFLAFEKDGIILKVADDEDLNALRNATAGNLPTLLLIRRHRYVTSHEGSFLTASPPAQ